MPTYSHAEFTFTYQELEHWWVNTFIKTEVEDAIALMRPDSITYDPCFAAKFHIVEDHKELMLYFVQSIGLKSRASVPKAETVVWN